MDELIEELELIANKCESVFAQIESGPLNDLMSKVMEAIREVGAASANSWFGQKSQCYLVGFKSRTNESLFEENRLSGGTPVWAYYNYDQVESEILKRAKVRELEDLSEAAKKATKVFNESRTQILPTLEAIGGSIQGSEPIQRMLTSLNELRPYISHQELMRHEMPESMVFSSTRDLEDGFAAPPHISLKCYLEEQYSCFDQVGKIGVIAREAVTYLKQRARIEKAIRSTTMPATNRKICIGHGRDQVWRELKEYLQDGLKLDVDEFNMEPVAGKTTTERLQEMLDSAIFAFLIMTAEDEQADGSVRSRENVVHEAGLFQGRLGFKKAIILLENKCVEFSNIQGLGQIRFERDNLRAEFYKIHQVLQREKIVP